VGDVGGKDRLAGVRIGEAVQGWGAGRVGDIDPLMFFVIWDSVPELAGRLWKDFFVEQSNVRRYDSSILWGPAWCLAEEELR
jgi:hypothetical protein